MSMELSFFPPNKTKYKWGNKVLNTSCWYCELSRQKVSSSDLFIFPMSVMLSVDLDKDRYVWRVEVCDWKHKRSYVEGSSADSLKACLAAEKAGEAEYKRLMPNWVWTALKNKWRPPCSD